MSLQRSRDVNCHNGNVTSRQTQYEHKSKVSSVAIWHGKVGGSVWGTLKGHNYI